MKNLARWSVALSALALISCSFFSKRKDAAVEVKDVPVEAREPEEGLKHRLFVLPFIDEKLDRSARVAEEARRTVIRELARTGKFVMVAQEDFPDDVKKFRTPDGEYDMEALSKLAASVGVAAVLEGKIMDIRARRVGDQVGLIRQLKAEVSASVRLRLYAGTNAKPIMNDVRSATADTVTTRVAENAYSDRNLAEDPELIAQAVRKAVGGAIPGLVRAVEKLNWAGRVAMISGERIFINAGRLSGIQIGDLLKVTDEGDEVFDPETGRFIGKAPGRLKGTVEVISYFGKDGSIGVIHSGSGFKENDHVELY